MKTNILALTLFALCSCTQNEPRVGLVDEVKFEKIYLELLDSAKVIQVASDSVLSPVAKRILTRHNVTLDDFTFTVKEYQSDPKRWKQFYESISNRLDERLKANEPRSNPVE